MAKKLKSQQSESHSESCCCYFQNLPDELVILILTKLSSSNSFYTLDDIKSLGKCSTVCKRFNFLSCLVPTLSIYDPSIATLYEYCPKILNKFKHIRLLHVKHCSCTELLMLTEHKDLPHIRYDATYRPHNYGLVVVSFKKDSHYSDQQGQESTILLDAAAAKDDDFCASIREHTIDLIRLHHMLVSSIKDHKYLQRVVVTDFRNQGTFTLEEDVLVELRNCSSTNLEQVKARTNFHSFINYVVPSGTGRSVWENLCINIIEWCEKATDDHIHKDDDNDDDDHHDDVDGDITSAEFVKGYLKCLNFLRCLPEDPADVNGNDNKFLLGLLSDIKSDGNLL